MSGRTTVTLDEDVARQVKQQSVASGRSLRATLNDLVRESLKVASAKAKRGPLKLATSKMEVFPGLNYNSTSELHDYIERAERAERK